MHPTKIDWREIPGYEGLYEASSSGLIRVKKSRRVLAGSLNTTGYRQVCLTWMHAHRMHVVQKLIMTTFVGPPPEGQEIDHINRNRDDNRLENLRYVTRSKNQLNTKMRARNTSGWPGVSWAPPHKRWVAQAHIDEKVQVLGYFDRPQDAFATYQKAVAKYHGAEFVPPHPCPPPLGAHREINLISPEVLARRPKKKARANARKEWI